MRMRSGGEMLDEGKAELQELRSILSLSYGPLGAYVDPTTSLERYIVCHDAAASFIV